ncbi:MAG: LacI family DNA-binding transcriptional regulator [Gemmatimonadetes bacterium]|nr:LacI family DNA-binding transcriptional regulator [Gemmatimonadota bacterium]
MAKRSNAKVTTHDVAKRAGVSQPTVSLVLSRNPKARVAEGTRERVIQAATELGYRPNLLARGLVRRKSFSLGLIVPDLKDPFFADVASGAERVASDEGFALLLCDRRGNGSLRHIEALRGRQIDGVIIDAAAAAALPAGALDGLDVVLIDQPDGAWPGVASDAESAGRLAAEHLLGLGHRRFAFMGPAADVHTFRMRERGFVKALRAAGLGLEASLLRRGPATVTGGMESMRALNALSAPERPTAVFCANDLMALGAHKQCATQGVRVPADLSLVGCDDIEMARLVTPELTTVSVPAREIGARAARLLVDPRTVGGVATPRSRMLPVKLVVRGSTAPQQAR